MARKYFTLSKANALIPMVKEELNILQELKREYFEKYYELKLLKSTKVSDLDQIFKLECALEFIEMDAEMHVKNISSKGIQLKDVDHGLIDFPALDKGQEVLLCWKQGEDKIQYYHGAAEGFSGRKRIIAGQFDEEI